VISDSLCSGHHGLGCFPWSEHEKVAWGVLPHVNSCDVHANRCSVENDLESLFDSLSFAVCFPSYGCAFPGVRSAPSPLFDTYQLFHAQLYDSA
jgi:hypothetical protein